MWNSGCLFYLVQPDESGLPPAPSPLFTALRLAVLALVLLPLLLSLSTGARCLSAKAERLSGEKTAGVWASTVGKSGRPSGCLRGGSCCEVGAVAWRGAEGRDRRWVRGADCRLPWASGSGVGIYLWSRYVTEGWEMSSPWVAYQALILGESGLGRGVNVCASPKRTVG